MHGDPDAIRSLAGVLRDRAREVRLSADRVVRALEATTWTGRAADAAHARARRRAGDLLVVATLHETAADAVDRHAAEVEQCRSLLARAAGLVS